jgi:hypothetical protein
MHRRTRPALAAGTAALLLAGALAEPATAAPVRHYSGYHIRGDGTAAGNWIGSWKVGHRVAYRIDPRRAPQSHGFQAGAASLARLDGTGAKQRLAGRDVTRAAWILSKYGSVPIPAQAAAVDTAVYALLAGGPYRVGGPRSARRLLETGHRTSIRRLTAIMLRTSKKYAGPYRLGVGATGTVVGGQVGVRVRVVAAHTGAPIAHLPVTVSYPGASARRLETGSDGRASTSIPALHPGDQQVRVKVSRIPESRLIVRRPKRHGESRVVLAGFKQSTTRTLSVAVRAKPTVTVKPVDGNVDVGQTIAPRFTLSGGTGSGSRTVTITAYGPFTKAANAACTSSRALVTTTTQITANGTYTGTPVRATTAGYYEWKVAVPADRLNLATSTCGARTVARSVPTVTTAASPDHAKAGGHVRARVTLRRMPPGYSDDVTAIIYGPYAKKSSVGCGSGKILRRVKVHVSLDGPHLAPTITVAKAGVYGWRAVLPASALSHAASSSCGAAGSFVTVSK